MAVLVKMGEWSFWLPERWATRIADDEKTYVEAPDKARGVYIQEVKPTPAEMTAKAFASQLQDVNLESYIELDDSAWKVVSRRSTELYGYVVSGMDIFDARSQHCVRFIVAVGVDGGLRLALHDYLCDDYAATKVFFDSIEATVIHAKNSA